MTVELYLGDCLEYMKSMPDKSVDAIITDLPYGTTACSWDEIIPFAPMWEQVKRIDKGVFVTAASQPFTSKLIMSNLSWFKYEWIWDKKHGANFMQGNKRPINNYEDIVVFSNGQSIYNPQKIDNPRGVETRSQYKYSKQKTAFIGQVATTKEYTTYSDKYEADKLLPKAIIIFDRENGLHPTQKPIKLYDYLIRTYTNEGDTVLDICMGSGTTGVACMQLGRNFIGCEIDPNYFAIAEKRIKQAQVQMIMEFK